MKEKVRIWADILIVFLLGIVAAWASARFNLLGQFHPAEWPAQIIHLDDLVLTLLVVFFALVWYAWRRRLRAIEFLEAAGTDFEGIVERSTEGLMVVDKEGVIRFANPAACAFLSSTREGLVGSPLGFPLQKDMLHETDISRGPEGLGVAAMEATDTVWQGKKAHLLTFYDRTAHLQSERALRESEERFRALVENQGEGVTIVDDDEKVIYCNPATERIFGIEAGVGVGRNLKEFVDEESFSRIREQTRLRRKGVTSTYEVKVVRPGGEERNILMTATPRLDREGTFSGAFGILMDVTERKKAELARQTLYRIAKAAASCVDLQDLYRQVHEAIGAHMSADNFYIALYDAPSGMLSFPYWVDEIDPQPEPRPLGKGLTPYVLRHRQPVLATEEVYEELRRLGQVEMVGSPSKVWLGVPLIVGEKTIGVMVVQDYESAQAKTDEDLHLMEFVSSEVAQAIERNRSTAVLRDSERRYREILENIVEGYYEVDLKGNLTFVSKAFCEILGRDENELVGTSFRRVMTAEGAEKTYAVFNEVFRTGKPALATDGEMIHKDGSHRIIETSVSLIPISEKRYSGFRGLIHDVTDRLAAERLIRKSEERYRDLVENSVDFIGTYDLSGNLLSANPAAARYYGFDTPEQFVGRNLQDFIVPAFRHLFAQYLERIKREGREKGLLRILTCKGEERTMAYDNTLKVDGKGEAIVRTRGRDVTAEKLAEKALKASERRYRSLFENNMAGVYRTTAKGVMLDCNQAMASILGYASPDELKRVRAIDLYPDSAERGSYLDSLRRNGSVSNLERNLVKKDGTLIRVILCSTLIPGESPEDDLIDGTLIDITGREQLAQEQMRTKRLETVAALAAGVAHEVRNPLFAIQVNLAALTRRFAPEPDARQHMEYIVTHVKRLDELVRSLLELGQALEPDELMEIALGTVIQSACVIVGDESPGIRDRIVIVGPGESLTVRIAHRQIVNAFVHILRNAAQVTPEGGTIRVECARAAGAHEVLISDEGPGIPERIRKTLFQPFATTRTGQPGLGLALAMHYVESHGGNITAQDNDPPPGATFIVRLPAAKPPKEA